jgi:hypothetical protein
MALTRANIERVIDGYSNPRYNSRNNEFTDADLARARSTGQLALAAKLRGMTTKQLEADFNPTTRKFRTLMDFEGRRLIAENFGKLTLKQRESAVKSGKLNLLLAVNGTTAAFWMRSAANGYRAGAGWGASRPAASRAKKKNTARKSKATPARKRSAKVKTS